jgi:type I restriction enzyme S subunit
MLVMADSLTGESRTLAELRDALLPKLVSGQIRVREAEEMVESV